MPYVYPNALAYVLSAKYTQDGVLREHRTPYRTNTMKPYQFFCYTAKYFRLLEKQEQAATEQRAKKIQSIREVITSEVARVERRILAKQTTLYK